MGRKQKYDALMEFIARVQGATGLTTPHIERVIANGLDISTATPADVYKLATGMDLLGPAQAYVPPAKKNVSAAIPGLSFEERVASDPNIQSAIKLAGPAIARTNPELAQRVAAGDTEAMLEVYRMVVKNKGEMPASQMELPLGEDAPSTGLIPFGVGGEGVPVGGVAGPGVASPDRGDLILSRILGIDGPRQGRLPAPRILGLPAPQQARLAGPGALGLPEPSATRLLAANPEMSQQHLDRLAETLFDFPDDAAQSVPGVTIPSDSVGDVPVAPLGRSAMARRAMNPLAAAAAVAAGLAASRFLPTPSPLAETAGPESSPIQDEDLALEDDSESLTDVGNPADLVAQTSPPPSIRSIAMEDSDDGITRSADVALGGTLIRPGEMISGMKVGGMNPLRAAAINRASEFVADPGIAPPAASARSGPLRRPGPDTGFIETNSAYALKPAQQRTLEVMLDAGIDPARAESIVRGQRSLTSSEERAIISNGPARARRAEDEMMTRRNARMGAY